MTQTRIDKYFNELEQFINKLPMTEKAKRYIWFDSFCKFYDEYNISEDETMTYGIKTEWQLKNFIDRFNRNYKKLRLKFIYNWTENINKTEPTEALIKIRKELYTIRKKELLTDIGGEKTNNWENWLMKYLANEIDHQEQREIESLKQTELKLKTIAKNNPRYESIFSNNGFILFEYLLNEYIRPKGTTGRFADISDYYWKMYNSQTQYIHQRPEAFKEWFFQTYDKENIGKIKTADNLKNIDRDKHYSNSLDWFKTKNE